MSEKIQCIVWQNSKCKGGDLSMLELSNIIILNANNSYLGLDYFYLGIAFSMIISCKFISYLISCCSQYISQIHLKSLLRKIKTSSLI